MGALPEFIRQRAFYCIRLRCLDLRRQRRTDLIGIPGDHYHIAHLVGMGVGDHTRR
jgi:hypothetical protein